MRYEPREDQAAGLIIGGAGPILVALALVSVRDRIDNANIAMLLVLVVVAAAAVGGRRAGALAAVTAAASFDFFFTQPYLTLAIKSGDDILTTLVLLVIGLAVGQLAVAGWRGRDEATLGHRQIAGFHRVAELAASGASREAVVEAVCEEVTRVLRLRSCRFEPGPVADLPVMSREGAVGGSHVFREEGFELPESGIAITVQAGGQYYGYLRCEPLSATGLAPDRRLVAVALADQLGLVLSRTEESSDPPVLPPGS